MFYVFPGNLSILIKIFLEINPICIDSYSIAMLIVVFGSLLEYV